MNIAVCLKQVPDTADLRIDKETNTLIREGVEAVLNPLDEFPLEAALRLRQAGGGRVTVVTMGPPAAADVLRTGLAFGADEAVLLSDRAFAGADTWATSLTLAAAIRETGPFDLVLCGKQAVDGDTAQVGPEIAAHLDWAQVTYATRLEREDDRHLLVDRLFDDGHARLRVRLPAVVTVLKEANEPRLPSLSARIRSLRCEIRTLGAHAVGIEPNRLGLEGSPTRVDRIAVPESGRQTTRFEGGPAETAQRLAEVLAPFRPS